MSTQGDAGASGVANEILTFLRKKIEENRRNPKIVRVLREVEKEVEFITDANKNGWY